jgi:hypothetical protein
MISDASNAEFFVFRSWFFEFSEDNCIWMYRPNYTTLWIGKRMNESNSFQRTLERFQEIRLISENYRNRARVLGSDLDEASTSAMEYYVYNPASNKKPIAIFRMCLRRERAKRLRFATGSEHS